MNKNKPAFTLLELVIVVVIVAVLAGLGISQYRKTLWRARFAEVYNTIGMIVKAKEAYRLQYGNYGGAGLAYTDSICGNGSGSYSHIVEQSLDVTIPSSSRFQYWIYPVSTQPGWGNAVFFGIPGEGCQDNLSAYYNYDNHTWGNYIGTSCPSRDNFVFP